VVGPPGTTRICFLAMVGPPGATLASARTGSHLQRQETNVDCESYKCFVWGSVFSQVTTFSKQ
jgi:hypothetical protein